MASIVTRTRMQARYPHLALTGITAIALVLVAGVGMRQGAGQDGTATSLAAEPVQAGAVVAGRQVDVSAESTTTVYLLSSDEEAAQIISRWDRLAAVGLAPPRTASDLVMVARSEEEAAAALRLPAEVQRWVDPLARVRVLDLRSR